MRLVGLCCVAVSAFCLSQSCAALASVHGGHGGSLYLALTGVIPPVQPLPEWAKVTQPVPRKALVIGVDKYDHATQLSTPSHDADIVASTLGQLGFQIRPEHLLKGKVDREQLLTAMRQFSQSLAEGDVAFVFFSGHGVERDGINFLVPSSGEEDPESPGHSYVSLTHLLGLIENSNVAAAVIVLDACRTNPFASTDAENNDVLDLAPVAATSNDTVGPIAVVPEAPAPKAGLAQVDTGPPAVLLAYAAQPQHPAYSLFKGDEPKTGSIFTRTVAHHLRNASGFPVTNIFTFAETDVFALTQKKQKPFQNPFGMHFLMLAPNGHLKALEEETWARSVAPGPAAQQIEDLKKFLRLFPGSEHSFAARKRLAELSSAAGIAALAEAMNAIEPVMSPIEGPAAQNYGFSVTGKLQTMARNSDGTVLAGANRDVVMRQNWNTIFKSRDVGTIKAGEIVKVVGMHPGGKAVQVVTNDGRTGYVGNLGIVSDGVKGVTTQLTYSSDAPSANVIDWAPLDRLDKQLASPKAVIKIRPASGKTGVLAEQIGQLRALRLRDAIVSRGANPERVLIVPTDASLPSQTAQIELVEAPQ